MEKKRTFSLTEEQLQALKFLETDFLGESLLCGSAGTGKTTVVAEFCRRNSNVLLTAPTHKAVKVLADKLGSEETRTIHSFLKLKKKLVGNEYRFIYNANEWIFADFEIIPEVVVIDEASMLSSDLLDHIFHAASKYGFRLIFVGDDKQLNPVGESHSPVFHQGINSFELTEIVRHQNDIIDLSRNLDWLYNKKSGTNFVWFGRGEVPVDKLVDSNGSDDCKFITWTNRTVDLVNKQIRQMLYGDPAQFELDEWLLMSAQYKEIYRNNEEVLITRIDSDHIFFDKTEVPHPSIETYVINDHMHCVKLEEQNKYKRNLHMLKEKAKIRMINWKVYYDYLELFGDYQYNHAVTVHKAQGSTYKTSIVNISEILRNPNELERNRMLYTAITRASENNYLI